MVCERGKGKDFRLGRGSSFLAEWERGRRVAGREESHTRTHTLSHRRLSARPMRFASTHPYTESEKEKVIKKVRE